MMVMEFSKHDEQPEHVEQFESEHCDPVTPLGR